MFAHRGAQGKVIGVLVLGERGDNGQYAGPDFEAIALIEARYSPVLETARLDAQASRHVAILDALYSGIAGGGKANQSVEEAAVDYTGIACEALQAGVGTMLYRAKDRHIPRVSQVRSGAELMSS